jgi:hypothetical protein
MKFNELSHMMQKPEPKPDTYEAGMALNQLLKIGTHAIKIHNMIDDAAEMEAWVAKKIDLASNYVKSVHGYTAGSKAGTYDDDGMSEMKKMPKGTGTMQGVKEDAGEGQASQKLAQHFQKIANEYKASGDTSDEYEEMQDIADAFRTKGIQAGIDEINSSYFEFSSDPFGRQEHELEPADKNVVDLLKQAGYTYKIVKDPNISHHTFKRKVVLQKIGKEVSEDAGEGHMSKSQLYQTAKMSIELLDMIKKGDDLEGWVQTKLNLAADYLQAVYHYEDYQKLNPYREELDGALMQKHAGIIQKHLDEILERKCRTEDVDTKPGMMRILKKRVNEVEKEIAKENRKETNEEATIKPYVSMYRGKDGKMVYDVLDKHEKSAFKTSDERVARAYLSKNYNKLREAVLDEGIREWGKRLAMAGVIVAGLAGVNSINNAIDNSIPAVKAMNTALEMAQDSGNTELAKMIEKDLSDAKIRLTSGKDLTHVADLQNKYAKFMKTEGLAYESKLAVNLKQRLK